MERFDDVTRFEDEPAWRAAHDLALQVYKLTEREDDEPGSIRAQLRALATTVGGKIAAGIGSGDHHLLVQNLSLSYSALMELRTLLYIARDMDELDGDAVTAIAARATTVGNLLQRMTDRLPAPRPASNGHDTGLPPLVD